MKLFDNPPPFTPWQEHSQTSQDAAFSVKQTAAAQRESVYKAISDSPAGLTDGEIQRVLGISGDSERPRRVELHQSHRIKEAGTRKTSSGRQAVVWVKS